MSQKTTLHAVRGAVTIPEDSVECLREELSRLLTMLVTTNHIRENDIVSVFFTVTPDLNSISPAQIAREKLSWQNVPMICAQEPDIVGLPSRCIRVLIQFQTDQPASTPQHIYLNDATQLRPDWIADGNGGEE